MSKKRDSHLLIPGPDGWEIWKSNADEPYQKHLEGGPLLVSEIEDIPSGQLVMGFPARQALAVPFKVQTEDEAMFDDLASLHLEKSGIHTEEEAGRLSDYFPVDHHDGETTLLAVVLSAPDADSMPLRAPNAFDVSARFFPMEENAITFWRELGRMVFAISTGGKLTYFQALSGDSLNGDTIRDVFLALTQLGLQGVNLDLRKAVVWNSGSKSDPTDEQVQALGSQLGSEISFVGKPDPVLPEPVSRIIPADARTERRRHAEKQKRNNLIAAVAVIYLLLVAYFGYQYFQLNSQLTEQNAAIKEVKLKHSDIALFNADWDELAPLVDSKRWPLQLLYRTATIIPKSQDLRFTIFDANRERITIRGEAADLKVASSYAEKIRRMLPEYKWSLPPAEADNKTNRWKFSYEGVLKGGIEK